MGIAEVGEVLERCACCPFLTLEQHGNHRREQCQCGGHPRLPVADEMAETFARGAVADLVMILRVHDESALGKVAGVPANGAFPMSRILACIDERLEERGA